MVFCFPPWLLVERNVSVPVNMTVVMFFYVVFSAFRFAGSLSRSIPRFAGSFCGTLPASPVLSRFVHRSADSFRVSVSRFAVSGSLSRSIPRFAGSFCGSSTVPPALFTVHSPLRRLFRGSFTVPPALFAVRSPLCRFFCGSSTVPPAPSRGSSPALPVLFAVHPPFRRFFSRFVHRLAGSFCGTLPFSPFRFAQRTFYNEIHQSHGFIPGL